MIQPILPDESASEKSFGTGANSEVKNPTSAIDAQKVVNMIQVATVSRPSHGKDRKLGLPARASVRRNSAVVDLGFAFDASLFSYLRSTRIRVPNIVSWYVRGIEAVPRFAELVPSYNPAIFATIVTSALREKAIQSKVDLRVYMAQIGTTHGVGQDKIDALLDIAEDYVNKIYDTGASRLLAGSLLEADPTFLGVKSLTGSISTPQRLSWDTFTSVFRQFGSIYSALTAEQDLESIIAYVTPLLGNPEYVQLYETVRALNTLALPSTDLTLYSLFDRQRAFVPSEDTEGVFPEIYPIEKSVESEALPKTTTSLFGVETDLSGIHQLKYWGVKNPYAGKLDMGHILATIVKHDSAIFGLPMLDFDLGLGIEYTVKTGAIRGIPKPPVQGEALYDDPRISCILGLLALGQLTTPSGSSLLSHVTGFVNAYKITATNVTIRPQLTQHLHTMVHVMQAFSMFRNICWDALIRADEFSMLKVSAIEPTSDHNPFCNLKSIQTWTEFYTAMLDHMSSISTTDSSPSSLYHPQRIAGLSMPFSIEANFESALVLQPWYYIAEGNLIVRPPAHQISKGVSRYAASSGGEIVEPETYIGRVAPAYRRLCAGTATHHVIHGVQEDFPAEGVDLRSFIRHIPSGVHSAYNALGNALVAGGPQINRLPLPYIVSQMMVRSLVGYKDSGSLSSVLAAFLGTAPEEFRREVEVVERGDAASVVKASHMPFYSAAIHYDKTSRVIAAFSSRDMLLDLGDSRFVFIFDAQNMLFVENATSPQSPFRIQWPLFSFHESEGASPVDLDVLDAEVPKDFAGLPLGVTTAESSFAISSEPERKLPLGEQVEDSSEQRSGADVRIKVNDVVLSVENTDSE